MLIDKQARVRAITDHASTLLVEAGAGTGKTSLLAARVAMLLAGGARPHEIAAITFTELAASELLARITEYVDELRDRRVPRELELVLPRGVSLEQRAFLERASMSFDQFTCTTLHGFCERLIRPYPVEARLDPGAAVMGENETALGHRMLLQKWLRTQLETNSAEVLAEILLQHDTTAGKFIESMAWFRKEHRDALRTAGVPPLDRLIDEFRAAVESLRTWYEQTAASGVQEPDTAACVENLAWLARTFEAGYSPQTSFATLLRYACPERIPQMYADRLRLKSFKVKGKWRDACKAVGRSKNEAETHITRLDTLYGRVNEACTNLLDALAEAVLTRIFLGLDPFQKEYRAFKQNSALLDFDDLLYHARDLLRGNPSVRGALSYRFRHVLVDEFQDTDPIQCEILMLLCGEGDGGAPWEEQRLRPGQLFLVGDPKQSIYRFRGADIDCYRRVRAVIESQFPGNRLEITANFRSQAPILEYVNSRFQQPLAELGFAALSCTQPDSPSPAPRVACFEVGEPDSKASGERRRLEAEAIAGLCQNLIGRLPVIQKTDGTSPCKPGDLALLAPSSTDLWMYERALEQKGIPIASQAGKGLFRRQEVHDLIAITRVLSNSRDTLALGAFLRGPLLGVTEQELLDITAQLPPREGRDEAFGQLMLWTDPALVKHELAAGVLAVLQGLAKRAYSTSPFHLLSAAVEELRVRPLLVQRHPRHAERALANVDAFLEMAKAYGVRGLRVFAQEMSRQWADSERQVEGRSDSGAEAVQVITVHSAKGLEWPVVIATNMVTEGSGASGILFRASDHTAHCTFEMLEPDAYSAVWDAESEQLRQERLRLWYVLCTRARDLLLLPRHAIVPKKCWLNELDLQIDGLPVFPQLAGEVIERQAAAAANFQTRKVFAQEASTVVERTRKIEWRQPSRREIDEERAPAPVEPLEDEVAMTRMEIRGSTVRGTVLHKLMEEVLNGETGDGAAELEQRAGTLLAQLGAVAAPDSATGPCPVEMADTVHRTLQLELVRSMRSRLVPECSVYHAEETGANCYRATAGVGDAVASDETGQPDFVIDWKSNVVPEASVQQQYAGQLQDYLAYLGCSRGAIVYMTKGAVQEVRLGAAATA